MKDYISTLISRYFNNRHSPDTEIKIQQWLIDETHQELKDSVLVEMWEQINCAVDKSVYESLKEVTAKIGIRASRTWFFKHTLPRVASVIIPLFVLTAILVNQWTKIETIEFATLAGEQKEIQLPDGTTVWLNACSKISYPERFNDSARLVSLVGEAYFSVVKSKIKRFVVNTKEIRIEVLGTQFNVKAYLDEELVTATLTKGKITVFSADEQYSLRPNQELVYNIVEQCANIQNVPSDAEGWKEGILNYNNMTMSEILRGIERQYGVKFNYLPETFSNDKYSIKFNSKENIEQLVSVLQDVVGGVIYTVDNKIITISKIQVE